MPIDIAELRRLEAEATQGTPEYGKWSPLNSNEYALYIAMRNALPELLKALEALKRLSTYEAFTNEGWGYSHPEITARIECARAALLPHGGGDVA
jgi:hypothetical protein